MASLNSITSSINTASLQKTLQGAPAAIQAGTSLINAFLVAVQKVNFDAKAEGQKGYLFTQRGDDEVSLQSDITDYYIEDNTTVQDQVALRPVQVTLKGFIGELTNERNGILALARDVSTQLTALSPYAPKLTASALIAYNEAQRAIDIAAQAATGVEQLYDLAVGKRYQSRQQKAYDYFSQAWERRLLFTVMTPWNIFEDMAILSLRVTQGEETDSYSDFSITFKEMNFAETEYRENTVAQARTASMTAGPVDRGSITGINTGVFDPTTMGLK